MNKLTVKAIINAPITKVWEFWTLPEHIVKWNFASPDWHCPEATNDLIVGKEFHYLMAAKDGTTSFDFWGTYTNIEWEKRIEITLGDGRKVSVSFEKQGKTTFVEEQFEPENQNPLALQEQGWQMILYNFKKHTENNL